MSEVAGVDLRSLEDPLHAALSVHESITQGQIGIDVDMAVKLDVTPDKPNSARSVSEVTDFAGNVVSKLYVIAFQPNDGTGDERDRLLQGKGVAASYPLTTKIVPRNKAHIHREVHLTLLTQSILEPNSDPELFRGQFDMMGIPGMKEGRGLIKRIAEIGHLESEPEDQKSQPRATYTVAENQERPYARYGDPHSIYSSQQGVLQVCGFIAIDWRNAAGRPDILESLRPVEPDVEL